MTYEDIVKSLEKDDFFGVLAHASTSEIIVFAKNQDTSIGDLFLIPSDRGGERVYLFRMSLYANALRRDEDMEFMAKNELAWKDAYYAEDLDKDKLLKLSGVLLGYAELLSLSKNSAWQLSLKNNSATESIWVICWPGRSRLVECVFTFRGSISRTTSAFLAAPARARATT